MYLYWSEELATHHREIDTHHRFIVKAINRMRVANSSRPRDLCGLLTIMTSLANLLALHFRYEEVLLEQCGYPERGETAVDHGYILGQIESMRYALSCQQEVSFRQVSLFAFTLFIHLRKEAGFAAYLTPHGAHAAVPPGVPVGVVTSTSTVVGMTVHPLAVRLTSATALQ